MSDEHDPSQDPLELDAIARDIRINELSEQVKDLGMGSMHVNEDCPPDLHEQFLQNIVDYESAPTESPSRQLTKAGTALPKPESLDDAAVTAKLWEVINALSAQSTYLHHTNHLSDRQLYARLWTSSLREHMPCMSPGSGWTNHIDLIGSGSDEHIQIGLRYYDTGEQRRRWAQDFPEDVIPPHEDPPYDRDRLLPKSPDEIRRLQMLAELDAGEGHEDDVCIEGDDDPAL